MPDTILLVEDDPHVLSAVRRRLEFEGFAVQTATNGTEALERLAGVHLVILDVMLPGLNGLQVAERIRADGDLPILMLTARDTVQDRVGGLESGADDYLVKPFAIEELLARIRALLRRHRRNASNTPALLAFSDLCMNTSTHEVSRGDVALSLTPREFALLEYFMRHARTVVNRNQLFEQVWGYDHEGSSNLVDVYMKSLRNKLEQHGARLLHTLRGVGYILRE